jgi:deoxyribodipyrimidine photo-lyase
MSVALVWLRQDLRVADNPLLCFERPPESLLCVYVLDASWLVPQASIGGPRLGPARLRFLWESLIELRGQLLKRGSDLLVRSGEPVEVVASLAKSHGVSQVRVRRDAGHDEAKAVERLTARLEPDTELWLADGGMLFDECRLPMPIESLPASFSSFRRRVESDVHIPEAFPAPVTLPPWPETAPRGLPPLGEVCEEADGWLADERGGFRFGGGEAEGRARLDHYLWQSGAVARYKHTRNELLGADFSTRLSPWLAHGCLSARQVHDALRGWEASHGANESSDWLFFELLWRDYFHWSARQEGAALFGGLSLPVADDGFRAWCQGHTGVPLVDAAMCELAATGWLSNRARQNVASFLINELDVDWRLGAAWFEHCLIDHDVASNWGNWRYISGTGRNSRVRWFDVLNQAQRYDPEGRYVAHWQPELAVLPPGRLRHQPWRAGAGFPKPRIALGAWKHFIADAGEERA